MTDEEGKIVENDSIVDHVEAIREIVERKCGRCGRGGPSGCMGCLFDSLDPGMVPGMLDRILDLMGWVPNERREAIAAGQKRNREREARWRRMTGGDDENGRASS